MSSDPIIFEYGGYRVVLTNAALWEKIWRSQRDPKPCREFAEHTCLLGCDTHDDPDHIHYCHANDFDFTEGEWQRWRLGILSDADFQQIGLNRRNQRTF